MHRNLWATVLQLEDIKTYNLQTNKAKTNMSKKILNDTSNPSIYSLYNMNLIVQHLKFYILKTGVTIGTAVLRFILLTFEFHSSKRY